MINVNVLCRVDLLDVSGSSLRLLWGSGGGDQRKAASRRYYVGARALRSGLKWGSVTSYSTRTTYAAVDVKDSTLRMLSKHTMGKNLTGCYWTCASTPQLLITALKTVFFVCRKNFQHFFFRILICIISLRSTYFNQYPEKKRIISREAVKLFLNET